MPPDAALPRIHWEEQGEPRSAPWRSASGQPPPRRVQVVDDRIDADSAWRLACEGTALLWRGDYHNGWQLLQAMGRRSRRSGSRKRAKPAPAASAATPAASAAEAFHLHRMAQGQRARTLGMLLLEIGDGGHIALRRAPDVAIACAEAWGEPVGAGVVSLRELLGVIGAHEWRHKGVHVPALGARIHPHYGVFSPLRGEYIDLVAAAPLPDTALAFDIGTGSGVLAAVLARRGVRRVVATDCDSRALACAADNLDRLGLQAQVELVEADLFPPGRAPLIVCNPPWLPAKPSSALEHAVYDPDSRMLRSFLAGLAEHLQDGGEAWLILSDFAEHLGLRSREQLLDWIASAGLQVLGCDDIRPRHPKAADADDALHAARAAEVTSLWRLGLG